MILRIFKSYVEKNIKFKNILLKYRDIYVYKRYNIYYILYKCKLFVYKKEIFLNFLIYKFLYKIDIDFRIFFIIFVRLNDKY